MNSNFRVRNFVVAAVAGYLILSVTAVWVNFPWFKRINLIGNIVTSSTIDAPQLYNKVDTNATVVIEKQAQKDFDLYKKGHLITNFNSDTLQPALSSFLQKLYALKTGKKVKVRIAYFGDSMIESDLLSQTLRKLLQGEFGGAGVGFIPISSQNAGNRTTAIHTFSSGWQDQNFHDNTAKENLFLSGHSFKGNDDWVRIKDQTINDSSTVTEKALLCGYLAQPVTIEINNSPLTIHPQEIFNRISLQKSTDKVIRVDVANAQLPVYGISFETESGVIVDNFSFRGITGVEYNKIDSNFLHTIAVNNPYDLIIFQYGVNLMFRPNDVNFNWYAKIALPAIKKLQHAFSSADFLLVGTADRAFNYDGEYKSAIGIDTLIKVQATLAYQTNSSFYNHFETMGGHDAIVRWANETPSLANKDYVHPNARGAEVLGKFFFEAIMNDYKKYTLNK